MHYGKTYLKCVCSAQDEDLLHRSLNCLADQQSQQQIKFVKDPGNIYNALYKVVKYREMCQSGNLTKEGTGQWPMGAAHMTALKTEVPGDTDHSEDDTSG